MKLPPHKIHLSIEHNEHKLYHQSMAEWIRENTWCQWKDAESQRRAITTDECWTLQWYPETAGSSYAVAASTLEEVIEFAEVISRHVKIPFNA